MARYIDIDLLFDKVEETTWYHINKNGELVVGANSETDIPLYKHSDIMRVLAEATEADVVPKSEVERLVDKWIGSGELKPEEKTLRLIEALKDEARRYERYYFNHEYDKLIAEAKAEVARDIFEDIEEIAIANDYISVEDFYIDHPLIAELKKKYTEVLTNEN